MRSTFPHRVKIKAVLHPPSEVRVMRQRRAALDQAEEVAPFKGRKPGMKVIRHPDGGQNGHGRGAQMVVQSLHQAKGVPIARHIQRGDLSGGMHARIGAACRGDGVGARLQLGKGRLYRALNRGQPLRLALPAREGATVVFDFQGIARHDPGITAWGPWRP